MLKKIKKTFYITSLIIFVFFTMNFYFSKENVIKTNKSRLNYSLKLDFFTKDLPLLENDTSNIIEYRNDTEIYKKKKKKYFFWNLLNKSKDES